MNKENPIGVFDSGIGGLTVAKELKRLLPNENIIYFGDSKHLPYGDKSKDTLIGYAQNITQFLLAQQCKAIVIACNTASATALKEVKELAKGKALVFDVISPVAEKVAFELNQKIGVIATKATVNTHLYKKSIRKLNKHIEVTELATPLLVPVIEEGFINHSISKTVLNTYLDNKKLQGIDTLVLGCTHYPLIYNEVKQYYENKINIIDSPLIVANHVYHSLRKHKLLSSEKNSSYRFYFSDITPKIEKLAKKFFGNNITLELKVL